MKTQAVRIGQAILTEIRKKAKANSRTVRAQMEVMLGAYLADAAPESKEK